MSSKRCACLCVVSLFLCVRAAKTQEDAGPGSASIQLPRVAIERLANVTSADGLWILLPSNFSEGQHLNATDFSLFKLNTDTLGESDSSPADSSSWIAAEPDSSPLERAARDSRAAAIFREGRKMNLFSNVLNKPKVSPLYLVNGTVCRFVNTQPICTTLTTTGLFRGQTPIQANSNSFLQGQQQQQQQQQQGNNFNPQQRQVSPNQPGFNSNQQTNFQPFRPAALLEDEGQDLNVEATNGSLRSASGQTKSKPTRQQVSNVVQATRPLNYVASRRPLNLLSFGRPFRSQLQRRGKELPDPSRGDLKVIE